MARPKAAPRGIAGNWGTRKGPLRAYEFSASVCVRSEERRASPTGSNGATNAPVPQPKENSAERTARRPRSEATTDGKGPQSVAFSISLDRVSREERAQSARRIRGEHGAVTCDGRIESRQVCATTEPLLRPSEARPRSERSERTVGTSNLIESG